MIKKNDEKEEFRMNKTDFEEMMRKALGSKLPEEDIKISKKKKSKSKNPLD